MDAKHCFEAGLVRQTGEAWLGYIYIYIRRPLQSVERVRLHLLAYNIQSLSNSHPSKQGPEEDISPASSGGQAAGIEESYPPGIQAAGIQDSPGGQAAGIEESYPPGTQAAGIQDLGARMLRSYHLIFFYRRSTRLQQAAKRMPQAARPSGPGRHRAPQAARPSGPESSKSLQIGALARTGMLNSSFGDTGYSSGGQLAPGQ